MLQCASPVSEFLGFGAPPQGTGTSGCRCGHENSELCRRGQRFMMLLFLFTRSGVGDVPAGGAAHPVAPRRRAAQGDGRGAEPQPVLLGRPGAAHGGNERGEADDRPPRRRPAPLRTLPVRSCSLFLSFWVFFYLPSRTLSGLGESLCRFAWRRTASWNLFAKENSLFV